MPSTFSTRPACGSSCRCCRSFSAAREDPPPSSESSSPPVSLRTRCFGTRVVLVAAMLSTAALFLAYQLPLPIAAFVVVRLLHGAAQGAYWPAANGLLAEVTPLDQRGRAFGYMQATNMGGMLIGPAVGGFIALLNLGVVFTIAATLSAITVLALVTLPNVRAQATVEVPARAMQISPRLLPLLLLGARGLLARGLGADVGHRHQHEHRDRRQRR